MTVDWSIHGLLRLRAVDAPDAALARIGRTLGAGPEPSAGDADLTIRWGGAARAGTLRWIGRHRSAFDDANFYAVERLPVGGVALAAIPFEQLGRGPVEIVCDRDVTDPPSLIPLLNVVLLGKGTLPLHGSAFRWKERGVVAAGWSKGGKTEALLAFWSAGAEVVADEWSYATADRRIVGVAEPVRLERSHLRQCPEIAAALPASARRRLGMAAAAVGAHGAWQRRSWLPGQRLAAAAVSAVEARDAVTVHPAALFGDRYVATAALDHVLSLVPADVGAPTARPTTAGVVAARMTYAHVHHRRDLVARYHEFRSAFPDRRCELLERHEVVERELLDRALEGVRCTEVLLPHPPAIAGLVDAVAPSIEAV